MSRHYQIEDLLRPPVEKHAARVNLTAALLLVLAPEYVIVVGDLAYLFAVGATIRGLQRGVQARRRHRYQRALRVLPRYRQRLSRIPASTTHLLYGQGFIWDQRHAQRLAQLEQTEYRHITEPRAWEHRRDTMTYRYGDSRLVGPLLKRLPAPPPLGGNPALHGVGLWEGERPITRSLKIRRQHLLVCGGTGMGKTRFAEMLISQDIRRPTRDVVIVFDPKSDPDLLLRVHAEANSCGRVEQLYVFHLGFPELSARWNAMGRFSRITEIATRTSRPLPSQGQSAAFQAFVWRYVNNIAKAQQALGRTVDLRGIKRFGEDIEPLVIDYLTDCLQRRAPELMPRVDEYERLFRLSPKERAEAAPELRIPASMGDRNPRGIALYTAFRQANVDSGIDDDIGHSLAKTYEYNRMHFDRLVASLLPLMEKLCTGPVADLISPDQSAPDLRPLFSWQQVIQQRGIVYVGLDALTDPEVAATVGNTMFQDLTSLSGDIYKHGAGIGLPERVGDVRVRIHADELNDLMGEEAIPMLNKAGGAGYEVTAYTQVIPDIEAKLGDRAKTSQVLGNFAHIMSFRQRDIQTSEYLTKLIKKVQIEQMTLLSGIHGAANPASETVFQSNVQQRRTSLWNEALQPADLTALPIGQAFAFMDGRVAKLRVPEPDRADFEGLPASIQDMARAMRERYQSVTSDWHRYRSSIHREAWDAVESLEALEHAA